MEIVVILAAFLSGYASAATPNVIIIHPDDMVPGYGGTNWHAPPKTPGQSIDDYTSLATNINKIGTEGAKFSRAYTASGMCSPSRGALITGRFPSRNAYAESITRASKGTNVDTLVRVSRHCAETCALIENAVTV